MTTPQEGEQALIDALKHRFPNLAEGEANLFAANLLAYMAGKLEEGWTLGLAKVGQDGIPETLRVLELKEVGDFSPGIMEDLFALPISTAPKKRKK